MCFGHVHIQHSPAPLTCPSNTMSCNYFKISLLLVRDPIHSPVNSEDGKNNNIQPFKVPFNVSSFYFDHRLTQQVH